MDIRKLRNVIVDIYRLNSEEFYQKLTESVILRGLELRWFKKTIYWVY